MLFRWLEPEEFEWLCSVDPEELEELLLLLRRLEPEEFRVFLLFRRFDTEELSENPKDSLLPHRLESGG